jgi:hypothetical protein
MELRDVTGTVFDSQGIQPGAELVQPNGLEGDVVEAVPTSRLHRFSAERECTIGFIGISQWPSLEKAGRKPSSRPSTAQ